ncbi:helicase domain protein [Nitzschia inconspicua]|uniref:Helicase domain protein n=1 Tax=Nitzschia inconspicua TaxID=303405 RepID=A0A9K3PSF5_9STRA|nr:helicase domain protein [Nitzschia inconspicua]
MTCCPSVLFWIFPVVIVFIVHFHVPADGWCVPTTSRRIVIPWLKTSTLSSPTTTRQPIHLSGRKVSTNETKERVSTKKRDTNYEKGWESTYQRLVKFRKEHGHTMVPKYFNDGDEKPHLGRWVIKQRSLRKRKDYSIQRAEKLDSIGFVWTLDAEARSHLSTNCPESKHEKTWESTYQRLVKFRNKHGHTMVPQSFNDGDNQPHLGTWVGKQRYRYKSQNTSYSKKRAEKLNSIGFVWTLDAEYRSQVSAEQRRLVHEKAWDRMYERLVKFQKKHGHTMVPNSFDDGEGQPRLGTWVIKQRYRRRRNDPPYSSKRAEKLDSIGFVWTLDAEDLFHQTRDDETWNKTVYRLKEYKQQHGHVNVPHKYNDGQRPHLGTWVSHQRKNYREYQNTNYSVGLITKERIEILESLGFEWNPERKDEFEDAWMSQFKAMKTFVKNYNTTKVSHNLVGYNSSIAITLNWAHKQRVLYNQYLMNKPSTITPQQIDLLNSIDFAWNLTKKTSHEKWIHEYFKLYCHHFQHNNTIISQSSGYNSDFVYWVEMQKRAYNAGKLAQGKIDLLNDLNFDWTPDPVTTWEDMYEQLSLYYDRFGSTLINTKIDKDLGMWTSELRTLYSKGDLDPTWVAKMNQLKFDWKAEDVNWNAMYDRLVAYKKKFGTVCVPDTCPDDPPLRNWVQTNRKAYKPVITNGIDDISLQNQSAVFEVAQKKATKRFPASIHAARLSKLLEIEFVWSPLDVQWQEMFDKLVAYKESNGHTFVPYESLEHPDLAVWVHNQRSASETMSEARKRALDAIGFVWDPLEVLWNEMFHKYCDMQARNVSTINTNSGEEIKKIMYWISTQRKNYRKGMLSKERISRLESAGFTWKL